MVYLCKGCAMRILLMTALFLFFQSCTHSENKRKSASDNESDEYEFTCGVEGTIEERIRNCAHVNLGGPVQDFVVVARLPNESLTHKAGLQNMTLSRSYIYKDQATGLLWASPRRFSGPLESAVGFCANNAFLNKYFPKTKWRLPIDQEIKTVFYKNKTGSRMHERLLGSKVSQTGETKYYDYHLKNNEFYPVEYRESESIILCVANT